MELESNIYCDSEWWNFNPFFGKMWSERITDFQLKGAASIPQILKGHNDQKS